MIKLNFGLSSKTFIDRFIHFLLIFLFSNNLLKSEDLYFRHYTNKDGLSHNTVYCSLQDKRGFMWFGTEEGLNRFDGKNFLVYET